jgi:nucleoporin p58/p45
MSSKSKENYLHRQFQDRHHKVCLLISHCQTQSLTPLLGISATLQVQHGTFLSLASKTAAVDAELQKIKALYTQLWRAKTNSVRDPFNDDAKRSETPADFGLGSLNVR